MRFCGGIPNRSPKNCSPDSGVSAACWTHCPPRCSKWAAWVKGVAALRLLLREMMARYAEAPMRERKVLCTPRDVAQMVVPRLSGSPHEELWTATVDAQNRLLTWERLARGTVGMVPCYPRDILERVLQRKASGFFLVHNHPGGTPKASPEDIEMTRNIQRIATSMGLRLLDHLIVGDGACYSIREDGLL